eukprot:TRINITY_DN1783_c0_g2_i1.p1 TRINITY_DN1783_c0_g2~~TRINITY_DN1783_c0_g2_i1.p1  ORF type:complete len:439 (-),score=117.28 TRINITY_DN1783_c0_g2_i1:96-1412(-)
MDTKQDEKRAYFREQALSELISTEKDYVSDLHFIISNFLVPLREQEILNKTELKALFSTIEVIVKINSLLLVQLTERLEKSDNIETVLLGDIFLKLADFLKVYTTYIGDQEGCISTFQTCKTSNKQFGTFLKELGRNPECRGLDMVSFLIKPVQRICKYPLLLKQIVSYTPDTAPDYDVMKQVLTKFEEVTTYANEHKRRLEKQQAMVQTSRLIVTKGLKKFPQLITPSRYFVSSGEFKKVSGNGMTKDVHLFLFNDLLVESSRKKKNGEFVQKKQISVRGLIVKDHPDTSRFKNLFEVREKSVKNRVYACTTRQEQESWRDLILAQVSQLSALEKENSKYAKPQNNNTSSPRSTLSMSVAGYGNSSSSSSSPSSPARGKFKTLDNSNLSSSLPSKNSLLASANTSDVYSNGLTSSLSEEDLEDNSYDETDDEDSGEL